MRSPSTAASTVTFACGEKMPNCNLLPATCVISTSCATFFTCIVHHCESIGEQGKAGRGPQAVHISPSNPHGDRLAFCRNLVKRCNAEDSSDVHLQRKATSLLHFHLLRCMRGLRPAMLLIFSDAWRVQQPTLHSEEPSQPANLCSSHLHSLRSVAAVLLSTDHSNKQC